MASGLAGRHGICLWHTLVETAASSPCINHLLCTECVKSILCITQNGLKELFLWRHLHCKTLKQCIDIQSKCKNSRPSSQPQRQWQFDMYPSILPRAPVWSDLILIKPPCSEHWCHPHFTGALSETQRGLVTCPRLYSMWRDDARTLVSMTPVSGGREEEGSLCRRIPLSSAKVTAYSFSHSTNVYWAWLCAGYMIHMGPLPSQNSRLRRETPSIDIIHWQGIKQIRGSQLGREKENRATWVDTRGT